MRLVQSNPSNGLQRPLKPPAALPVLKASAASVRAAQRHSGVSRRSSPASGPVSHSRREVQCRAADGGSILSGRAKQLGTLAVGLLLELALSGSVLYSPLIFALLLIIRSPSSESQQVQTEAAVRRAVEQARREMESRVPVTPPESAGWMNRMMAEIWAPFVVPQLIRENLSAWQEKVRLTAPAGWDIELQDMSMGNEAPIMSNYQAFNDPVTGRMTAMECDMVMDSQSMRVVVRGSGPLGSFTATVLGVKMKGRMRVLPMPDQRMLLWSYIEPPDAKVKLQVRGPLIGEQNVPEFSFIKSAFNAAIQDSLVEPRRAAVSLDYEYLVQEAVNTHLNIYIESIDGLTQQPAARDGAEAALVAAGESLDAASSLLASASSAITAGTGAALSTTVTSVATGFTKGSAKAPVKPMFSPVSTDQATPATTRSTSTNKTTTNTTNTSSTSTSNGTRNGTNSVKSTSPQYANGTSMSSQGRNSSSSVMTTKAGSSGVGSTGSTGLVVASKKGRGSGGQGSQSAGSLISALRRRPAVHVVVNNLETKLQRRSATRLVSAEGRASLNELLYLETGGKSSIVELQVRDGVRGSAMLGRALIHILASKDGCTLMWALGPNNEPLAIRWQPAMGPWRVTLPLENCASPHATITVDVSADPWTYAPAQLPVAAYKTPGPRTVVMQVMEAKDLAARDWAGTSDPYVQIAYSGLNYRTRTVYNCLRPVWGETFVFTENPSLLTRRVRLDVWDSGVSRDDSLGYASVSLDMAAENCIQDRWVQLAGEESGELRVRLVVVPGSTGSTAVQQMVALLSSEAFASASTSTLQVVVVAARGLLPRSASSLTGSERSVYASITFNNARQVTAVVKGGTNPTWNHSSLFPLDPTIFNTTTPTTTTLTTNPNTLNGTSATATSTTVDTTATTIARQTSPRATSTGTLGLTPYPAVPKDTTTTTTAAAGTKTASQGGVSGPGLNGARAKRSGAILRVELLDVALVPPDESLGWAELDVGLVVPAPGSIWEQWLPLREGGNAEVLVRVAHMAPSTAAQGALPLPQQMVAAQGAAAPAAPVMSAWSSEKGDLTGGGVSEDDDVGGFSFKRLNKAVAGSVNEQVRAAETATASAVRASEELRVKLGQDWIPKVQDWWSRVSQQVESAARQTAKSAMAATDTTAATKPDSTRASPGPSQDQAAATGNTSRATSPAPTSVQTTTDTTTASATDTSAKQDTTLQPPSTSHANGYSNGTAQAVGASGGGTSGSGLGSDTHTVSGSVSASGQGMGSTSGSGSTPGAAGAPSVGVGAGKNGFWVQSSTLPTSTGGVSGQGGRQGQGGGGLTWLGAWLQSGWNGSPSPPAASLPPRDTQRPQPQLGSQEREDASQAVAASDAATPTPAASLPTPSADDAARGSEETSKQSSSTSSEASTVPDVSPPATPRAHSPQRTRSDASMFAAVASVPGSTEPSATPAAESGMPFIVGTDDFDAASTAEFSDRESSPHPAGRSPPPLVANKSAAESSPPHSVTVGQGSGAGQDSAGGR